LLVAEYDVRERLAPGQLVRVVLVRPDEYDGPLTGWNARGQIVSRIEIARDAQVEHADELVDCSRRARPAEDHAMRVGPAHGVTDDAARLLTEPRRLEPRARAFRVRVGVQRQDRFPDVVLDE